MIALIAALAGIALWGMSHAVQRLGVSSRS